MSLRNLIVLGREEPPAPRLRLQAGPLAMWFEPETIFLRRISLGQAEIIRGIYAAVRDRNWGTVPPCLEHLQRAVEADSFRLTFGVACQQGDIDFYWHGEITGTAEGSVIFQFNGEARSTFLRNRIGFCVLHPLAACVGNRCEVERCDDTVERGRFPRFIAPHQPFKQMRALRHPIAAGWEVEVRFTGEVFEMEDQRNWTDASFKTYCTPLELPFPARIEQGTHIHQTVTVHLLRSRRREEAHGSHATFNRSLLTRAGNELVIPEKAAFSLPPIGLGVASHPQPLTAPEIRCLKRLGLSHLRVDLVLAQPDWRETLQRAVREAGQLGCALQVALFLTRQAEAELKSLAAELEALRPAVSLWLVFHEEETTTSERWVRLAKTALAPFGPDIPLATGTNANFAEFNRHRPAVDSLALPVFSINPQVHVGDNLSLVENLEAQAWTVETAGQFTSQPVVVSPITLKPRFNAVATGEEQSWTRDELPPQVDPRPRSLFAAAWTLGSLTGLSATGRVHSLTYYETTGGRGVMETEPGSPWPKNMPSIAGGVFPVFFVFAAFAGFAQLAPVVVANPLDLAALALFGPPDRRRLLLANLQSEPLVVRLRTGDARIRVLLLDETNVERAMREPEDFLTQIGEGLDGASGVAQIVLPPHAFARVDVEPAASGSLIPRS